MSPTDDLSGPGPEHERPILDRLRGTGVGTEDPNIVGDAGPTDVAPGKDPPLPTLTEELPPEEETPSERLLPSDAEVPGEVLPGEADPGAGFVGRWRLVSWSSRVGDGEEIHPFGEDLVGSLVYSEDGWMSAHIAKRDRQGPQDLLAATEAEQAAMANSYIAYCGPYQVLADRVVHRPAMSLIPSWVGTEQVRFYEIAGDVLVLRAPPFPIGGQMQISELTWQREP